VTHYTRYAAVSWVAELPEYFPLVGGKEEL
jgi:hypothetical protein